MFSINELPLRMETIHFVREKELCFFTACLSISDMACYKQLEYKNTFTNDKFVTENKAAYT